MEEEEADGDFDRIIDELGPEYLLELLQSEDGITPEILAELEKNPNLVELLQNLQDNTNNEEEEDGGNTTKEDSVEHNIVEVESEENVPASAPIVIIQSEGEGITVCHDGGESLRPKVTTPEIVQVKTEPPDQPQPSTSFTIPQSIDSEKPGPSNQIEIKSESHHKHKDKKRDKEKRHKDKEKKKKKDKEKNNTRPLRHPDFAKFRKKYNLLDTSVTVIKIETILPVERHMRLKWRRLNRIQELDRKQQSQVNSRDGKIRLVPLPRAVNAAPYKPVEKHKKHKDKDGKRKKIVIPSDSDSDSDRGTPAKQKKLDHKSKIKPHGEFSATGARILPFEKRANKDKEQEKIIKRPKMPEKEPEIKPSKDKKKDHRLTSIGGSKEGEDRVKMLLQQAIRDQKKSLEFRIPKSQQISEVDRGRPQVSTTTTATPLGRLRPHEENLRFDRPGQSRRPLVNNFPVNSYGWHKFNAQNAGGGGGGNDNGFPSYNTADFLHPEEESRMATEELRRKLAMRGDADFLPDDDDNPLDMHDDAMSDVVEIPQNDLSLPVEDLKISTLVTGVNRLLQTTACEYPSNFISLPDQVNQKEPSIAEVTMRKIAWWFHGIDKGEIVPILSEPMNPEIDDTAPLSDDGNGSVVSSFGNVSNPGNTDCQIYEITSSDQERANDPDVKDEFCGCSLIYAKFRISADDKFQNIFDVRPGSNYDKEKFNATCTICKEVINGKRDLGRHVRSENHRINFKKISLNIMPGTDRKELKFREESPPDRVPRDPSKIRSKDGAEKSKEKERNGSSKEKKEKKSKKSSRRSSHRRSRSRSRTPDRYRSRRHRSRSPRRRSRSLSKSPLHLHSRRRRSRSRSTSADKVADFLERTERSRRSRSRSPKRIRPPSDKPKKPSLFPEKLKLAHAGKWTDAMEARWKVMETEEAALIAEMQAQRSKVNERPEEHPQYNLEWETYWNKTYTEVQAKNQNADTYDYRPGWRVFWGKRVEELMEEEQNTKLEAIRVKYGMDYASLQRILLDIPTPPVPLPVQQHQVIMVPVPVKKDIYTPFEDDFTARSMSLSGASSHNSNHGQTTEPPPPGIPNPKVTTNEIMQTWEKLTGIGGGMVSKPKSEASASATGSGDLDLEMDLIQVLRLMNNGLEDQLSILATQIKEYSTRAESMEKIKARRSYDLLEDKEFVAILFQCRDKFMALIKANVLDRTVLRRVNKAVFGLNEILDTEPCQRLRPKPVAEVAATIPTPAVVSNAEVFTSSNSNNEFEWVRRPNQSNSLDAPVEPRSRTRGNLTLPQEGIVLMQRIREAFRDVSRRRKMEIADIIARALQAGMRLFLSDFEIVQYVYDVLRPAMNKLHLLARNQRSPSPLRSLDERREPIREVGMALPILPEIQCRAITPPGGSGGRVTVQQFQQVSMRRRDDHFDPRQGNYDYSHRGGGGHNSPRARGFGSPVRSGGMPRVRGHSPRLCRRGGGPPGLRSRSPSSAYSPSSTIDTIPPSSRSQSISRPITAEEEPKPGPSKEISTKEPENIPPPIKSKDNKKSKRKRKKGIGMAQEFWKSDNSSVSSDFSDWDTLIKKGSKSTISNGSNGRSQLKEVQSKAKATPPAPAPKTDKLSEAESGEIITSDEDFESSIHDNLSIVSSTTSSTKYLKKKM